MPAPWPLPSPAGVALALALAALAVRAMRRLRLHWSWALLAALPALLSGIMPASARTILLIAAVACALGARRRHRRDLEAGADLAELASVELRPLDVLLPLLRRLAERTPWRIVATDPAARAALAIGRDERGRTVSVPLGERQGRHVLVVGATGSGKTVTQSLDRRRRDRARDGRDRGRPQGRPPTCAGSIARAAGARRARSSSGRRRARRSTTRSRGAARPRSPTRRSPASASPSRTICARPSATSGTRCARCARPGCRSSLHALVEHLESRAARAARAEPAAGARASPRTPISTRSPRASRPSSRACATGSRSSPSPTSGAGSSRACSGARLGARTGACASGRSPTSRSKPTAGRCSRQMLGAAIVQDLPTVVATLQAEPGARRSSSSTSSRPSPPSRSCACSRARARRGSACCSARRSSRTCACRVASGCSSRCSATSPRSIAHRQVVPASAELIAQHRRHAGGLAGRPPQRRRHDPDVRTRSREAVLGPDRVDAPAAGWAAVIVPGCGHGRRAWRASSCPSRGPTGARRRMVCAEARPTRRSASELLRWIAPARRGHGRGARRARARARSRPRAGACRSAVARGLLHRHARCAAARRCSPSRARACARAACAELEPAA